MPEATYPRERLEVLRLYWEVPTDKYFYTPDGVGVIWFDDFMEALSETDAFGHGIMAIHRKLAD